MGYLQVASSTSSGSTDSHFYSQELQMKLYQAFIFSIPILFSIILFLLFYLFYLKRTFCTNNPSNFPTSVIPPRTFRNHASSTPLQSSEIGLKFNLEDKLIMILFDEDFNAKDSMCCVCLGEFEMNEKLHQIPSCQHMFHVDCIRNWLCSNYTCPLCRCSVFNSTKDSHQNPPAPPEPAATISQGSDPQIVPLENQEVSPRTSCSGEHCVLVFEGSSSTSMDNKLSLPNEEFVLINISSNA